MPSKCAHLVIGRHGEGRRLISYGALLKTKSSERTRATGTGSHAPTTRDWWKSFCGKSVMTKHGRKPPQVAVQIHSGFGLLPYVKRNIQAMWYPSTRR